MLKTVLLTASATAGTLALAAHLFLNTILGAFGLVATSADTLQNLKASREVVQQMKKRQSQKKTRITKRFVKRSGKRVASGALAAATVGTVAVVAAMTTIEITDYCEQQKELQEDLDVLNGTTTEFDLDECLQHSKEDAKAIYAEVKNSVSDTVAGTFESTSSYADELWGDVKALTKSAIDYTDAGFSAAWRSATSWFNE